MRAPLMTSRERFSNPVDDSSVISVSQLEEIIELQSDILSATVHHKQGDELLERLCLLAEKLTPGSLASIMIYHQAEDGLFVHTAPSMPAAAIEDLDGLKKGEGSCGNAVFYNEDMYVCDTLHDARWEKVKGFAEKYSINACWSSPIQSSASEAVGSFSLSSFTVRTPDNFQRRLLKTCASIASIIFQRNQFIQESEDTKNKLYESKENLAVTVDSIADGVISTDTDGNIVLFNQVAEKLTACSSADAVGRYIDEVFNVRAGDDEKRCSPVECLFNNKKCYHKDGSVSLVSADGTSRFIEISEALVKNDNGDVTGAVLAFRDITQQSIDHQKLIDSEERFRSILENTPDELLIVNENAEYVDVNQMACDKLGYTREEMLSMTVPDVQMALSMAKFKKLFDVLKTDKSAIMQGVHRRKDGSQFPVEARMRQYSFNGERFNVVSVSDITHRKHEENELLKARKLESIGLLAGGIAHDFNNLLGIIMGNIDLANQREEVPENIKRYLKNANNASLRAADLTQQLLTFSKGGEPVRKTADILEIIRESAEFSLHGGSVKAVYEGEPAESLWRVQVDSGQISQVVQNLAINARQAMPDGGILCFTCTNVDMVGGGGVLEPGKYIKIVVQDNGVGIPEGVIDSVFDPYFTTKQEGSGLGLALSYSIINKHKGNITVESIVGEGASFTIYLPVSVEHDELEVMPGTAVTYTSGSARVMVMDDDAMIREIGEAMLENLGYEVVLAEDGDEALTMYEAAMRSGKKIDLIVMDLTVLSGMGGKEALMKIKEIDPDVKSLVSSGYSNDPVMANFSEYGFVGALSKPYNQDELAQVVGDILKNK